MFKWIAFTIVIATVAGEEWCTTNKKIWGTHTMAPQTCTLTSTVNVETKLIISGDGSGETPIISGNGLTQLFTVYGELQLSNLILEKGATADCNGAGRNCDGGAIIAKKDCEDSSCGDDPPVMSLIHILFRENQAVGNGGAVFITHHTVLTMEDSTFAGNVATTGSGGGLFATDMSTITSVRTTFKNNAAGTNGGGLFASAETTALTLTDSTFDGNTATAGSGGGLYAKDMSTITSVRTTFKNNAADQNGGGLFASGPKTALTLTDSTFQANVATKGGALFLSEKTVLTLEGTTLENNRAHVSGGAIAAHTSQIIVQGVVKFNNNIAFPKDADATEKNPQIVAQNSPGSEGKSPPLFSCGTCTPYCCMYLRHALTSPSLLFPPQH